MRRLAPVDLAFSSRCRKLSSPAGVAELADARDSKSRGRKVVWVRFPPPACHGEAHAEPGSKRQSRHVVRRPTRGGDDTALARTAIWSAAGAIWRITWIESRESRLGRPEGLVQTNGPCGRAQRAQRKAGQYLSSSASSALSAREGFGGKTGNSPLAASRRLRCCWRRGHVLGRAGPPGPMGRRGIPARRGQTTPRRFPASMASKARTCRCS